VRICLRNFLAMHKFNLPFEKLSRLTTDGAPAMVGSRKGLSALVKEEMTSRGLAAGDLVVCHCITHQQSLCAKSLQLSNVMSTVHQFHQFYQKQRPNQLRQKHRFEIAAC